MDNQFGELPVDKTVDTKFFLESVAYLPPFFGEYRSTPERSVDDL